MSQVHGQASADLISGIPAGREYPSPHFTVDPANGNNVYVTFTGFGLGNTKQYQKSNIYFASRNMFSG